MLDSATCESMRLRSLVSWNVWGIPLGSPRTFGRSREWAGFVGESCSLNNPDSEKELHVMVFQEAWGWNCGAIGWLTNWLVTGIQIVFGRCWAVFGVIMLPLSVVNIVINVSLSWLVPIRWDTKDSLYGTDSECLTTPHSGRLPVAVGTGGMSSSCWKFLDSGLLLTASHCPQEYGFEAFTPTNVMCECSLKGFLAFTERFANKGVLWAYFSSDRSTTEDGNNSTTTDNDSYGCIVVTVHTAAPWCLPEVKTKQIEELTALLLRLKGSFESRTASFELYLAGDFNQPSDSSALAMMVQAVGLEQISKAGEPTHFMGASVDHVYGYWNTDDRPAVQCRVLVPPVEGRIALSDHYMLHVTAPQSQLA